MAEYMHLVGAEQVQIAANTMRSAASEMNRAANTISEALNEHKRVMEEFIEFIKMMRAIKEGK